MALAAAAPAVLAAPAAGPAAASRHRGPGPMPPSHTPPRLLRGGEPS